MSNWKLRTYLGLRLLHALALAVLALSLVGLTLVVVGAADSRAGGGIWIDFARSNFLLTLTVFLGSGGSFLGLGILLDRLGSRWKREVGKYR